MRNAKRLLIVLLSLVLVLSALFALTSCGKCKHKEWNDATCTAAKTCKECGQTEGEALGHTGGTATCTKEATCSVCGVSYGAKTAHDYAAATCVAPKTCKVCGGTDGTALGHEDANKDHACDRTGCTATVGEHADANKDHTCDYGCAVAIGDHADVSAKDHKCDYCGASGFGTHAAGTTDVHVCDYCGGGVSTCVDENKDHACDIGCNTPVGDHADANKDHACDYGCSVALGDHADANKDHTCDYGCSVALGDHADANKDHACDYGCAVALGDHADSDADQDHACDYGCGVMLSGHTGGTATCSVQATCTVCGVKYGAFAGHDFTDDVEALAYVKVRAACGTAAEYYYACSVCGANEKNDDHTFFGTATEGHKWGSWTNETIESVECHVRTCKTCGGTDSGACAYNPVTPLSTEQLGAPATCLNPAKCSVCANEYGVANGHSWNGGEETTPATCETAGVMTYTCACSATKTEAIAPTGHAWDDGVETTPATCTTAGVKTYTCQNDEAHTKTEQIAASGHLPNIPAPTCTADQVCGRADCGATIAPATGHSYEVAEGSATCTEARVDTYTCPNCGDSYTETVGAPLGHSFTDLVIEDERIAENSCEYTKYKYCERCESNIAVDTYVSHDSWTATVESFATCTSMGQKKLTCPTCGTTEYEDIPVDLELGHAWNEGVTENGITTYTCTHDATHTKTVKTVTAEDTLTKDDLSNELQTENGSFNLGGASDAIGDREVNLSSGKVEDKGALGLTQDQLDQIGEADVYEFVITDKATGNTVADFGEGNYVTVTLPYPQFNAEEDDADAIAIWFINDDGELESIMATYSNGYVTFKTNHFSKYTVTRLKPAERCALYGHSSTFKICPGSCLEDAYVLEYCVRCGYTNETVLWTAPLEHSYVEDTRTDAKCTEAGFIKYICGCNVPAEIKDLGNGYEVTDYKSCGHSYTVVLPALNHNWEEYSRTDATCTANGVIMYRCSNDYEHTRGELLLQLPHDYDAIVTEPTCSEGGYTTHTCLNPYCSDSYVDSYTAPAAHVYESAEAATWVWVDENGEPAPNGNPNNGKYDTLVFTLICDECGEEKVVGHEDLNLTIKNIAASCKVEGKNKYLVRITVNGRVKEYLVKEEVLAGIFEHEFSETVNMFDENTHWRGCKCGDKMDEAEHTFGAGIVTKVASCDAAGEITYSCDCGYVKTEEIPQLAHSFVNGVCSACGAKDGVANFYVTLLNSYKNMSGFAIRIEDLFFEVIEDGEIEGRIVAELAELMLYVEDGKLKGAAKGSVVIYNGPISNDNAYYALEAVIDGDSVYIVLTGGATADEQTMQLKYSLADVLASMSGGIVPAPMAGMIEMSGFVVDTLIPVVDTLIAANADDAEAILENLFAMFFTVEQTGDGYVFTLDYEKLYALNENLATLSVAEVIDLYFGEGTFDTLVDGVRALLAKKLSELPAWIEAQGLDYDALIEKINELCALMGAPAGFDVSEMINDPAYGELALGVLLFNEEDYVGMVDQLVSGLRNMSLYTLIMPEHENEIKDMVDMVIEMIKDSITVSFSTDAAGSLTDIDVALDDFAVVTEDVEVTVSVSLGITINGKIDVTWGDIVADINGAIVLPSEDMKNDELSINDSMDNGEMEYKGEWYSYEASIITLSKTDYSHLLGIMMQADCTGWMAYQAMYGYAYAAYGQYMLYDMEGNIAHILMKNEMTGETVEIVMGATGCTVIYEDGTELSLDLTAMSNPNPIVLLTAVFGEIEYVSAPGLGAPPVYYYYNSTTGEYSGESHHEVTVTVENLGETCEDGIRYTYTCEHCGFATTYTQTYCETTEGAQIDFSEFGACGGSADVERCVECGKIHQVMHSMPACEVGDPVEEPILDGNGATIGTKISATCPTCGLTFVQIRTKENQGDCHYEVSELQRVSINGTEIYSYESIYYSTEHDYAYTWEFLGAEDCERGVTIITSCKNCDYRREYMTYSHDTMILERITLEGTCNPDAYMTYGECPCGKNARVERWNTCLHSGSGNGYEGDDGKWHEFTLWSCNACGLTYREDRCTERDASTCSEVTYHEDSVTIGTTLIGNWTYESYKKSHDYYVSSASLREGSDSCEDGVTLICTCRDCFDSYDSYASGHATYEIARYNLQDAQYGGAYHQGYLVESACACGEYHNIEFDTLCDIGARYGEELWIDGVIGNAENGYHWVSFDADGFYNGYYSQAWRQTCAVTDPVQCAYTIRRASYWKKADGACLAERYETWQLGYDETTGTCAYEITFKTGESRQYHPYIVDEPEDTIYPNAIRTTTYTCPDCGSTAYDKVTIGADGEMIARVMYAENMSEYGNYRVREERYEYCNGHEFSMYEYEERMDGEWEMWEYDGFCQANVTHSTSNGKGDSYTADRHYISWGWKKYPTCTQEGIYGEWCPACDTVLNASREESPYDHSWQQAEENLWICSRCGIQNANGASGEVVLEDMTMLYGEGEYYVAGYWARNNATFGKYVALYLLNGVTVDGMDIVELFEIEVFELDNVRAVAFSMAEVLAAAEALGLSPEDYEVRLSFVPYDNLDEDDYGITFDKNYGDGSETVTGPITLQFMMEGWNSKFITIDPEVSGVYQIAIYTNNGCEVNLYDSEDNYHSAGSNFACILNAENSYALRVQTYNKEFAEPMTVVITYLGEAQ